MDIQTIKIEKPEATNFILGQSHFIKTVEDIHEALVGAVPGIKFGLAFSEASGKCLIRWSGTDEAMIELAKQNAEVIGAGHSFILFLGEGFYPINVLNAVKNVPEVARIFCATANPVEVLVARPEAELATDALDRKRMRFERFLPQTGEHLFALDFAPEFYGRIEYRVRAYPCHEAFTHPFEMGMMVWV